MMRKATSQAVLGTPAFDVIASLAHRECGLHIVPEKMMMVQSRLRHRLRALNLPDFETYSRLIQSPQGSDERRFMISALTTNVSHFFREPHHFDSLSAALLPRLQRRIRDGDRIRIWSAGCSNGQEPYSIAMHMLRIAPDLMNADFKILATDVDPIVIEFAQNGIYRERLLSGVSDQDKTRFLQGSQAAMEMTAQIRRCVTFRELNLLSDWPMRHPFDAIFCRNVVIYFDMDTQEKLWPRFNNALVDGGLFFLGHSERIGSPEALGFRSTGSTTYQKSPVTAPRNTTYQGGQNGTS